MRLRRGSYVVGRGGEGCHKHDSIISVRLGRSGDTKTARKTPKTLKRLTPDGQMDEPTYKPMDRWIGQHSYL